ncbi:hypothetical protein SCP_0311000 [Sparassis crispa]|uniref:AB hydrolase-1 domain-containing protein n=1 Tax=Sparassis crispa TaxID=139825 RepID=A0A401GGZ3_9APHY|nr:hypothetical protein SCP_0311000 [Sparassis crispa]GBE81373.1 hypothetical protein SCP_0311000 [Sparassis crispa]
MTAIPLKAGLYYEDSGSPTGSADYATLILIHGTIFHGAIFRRMFSYAAAYNLRLVFVTLRDYPGSTPFSTAELDVLHGTDETAQATFVQNRGLEITAFLLWYIQNHSIPPMCIADHVSQRSVGGLSVLAWSSGNMLPLSMLAHLDNLSDEDQNLFNVYIRTLVLFDAPFQVFGIAYPSLEELYNPLRDHSIPAEKKAEKFADWVSGYFAHSTQILSSLSSLSLLTREELFSGLAQTPLSDPPPEHLPTIARMSSAEIEGTADYAGAPRSHVHLVEIAPTVFATNLRAALGDATRWPHLRTVIVWCDQSLNEVAFAAWELAGMLKRWSDVRRKVEIKRMVGANHFPHWDQPEVTVKFLADII